MARLRKSARLWKPESRAAAQHALVRDDGVYFTIDPLAIFGRRAPLEIEIGAGKGEFIIARAAQNPAHDFLAVELSSIIARLLATRCGGANLPNLRVARMDARTLVNLMLPDASIAAYHIYFPDPWPKERHVKHRLFTPYLVHSLARTLDPEGSLFVATDVADYADLIFAMLAAGGFARGSDEAPGGRCSGFARKYLAAGKPVYSAAFTRAPAAAQTASA
ncbi:MAG TPA: hypothetical protein VIX59_07305 [Candidatus Binataceae bacterium]